MKKIMIIMLLATGLTLWQALKRLCNNSSFYAEVDYDLCGEVTAGGNE